MQSSTLSTTFISFRRQFRPLPQAPIHALSSRRLNQNSPLRISSTGALPHLLHHPPRCALLRPPSDQGKPKEEEVDDGEYHRLRRYDVFFSFRGSDVRHRIVDHIYASLLRKGIKPFKDDTQMERGLDVEDAISAAIEGSSIYLLIMSPGYASSTFCMDEAFEIMQRCCCCGRGGAARVVLPIFYLVSPDDVCLPTAGCFKEHFLAHFDKFTYNRVQGWMDAFSFIGKISGWVHENGRSEALLVEEVSTTIGKLVREMRSTTSDHFTEYLPPSSPLLLQLAPSRSAHTDQHMELEYYQPKISSTKGNDRIVMIPKPASPDHGVDHHHPMKQCLVAQHYYLRPGAGQLDMVNDIATIATEARSLWKDDKIEVEPLEAINNNGVVIRFQNEDTRNWVLESSPWVINGTQFFMRKLEPSPSPSLLITIPMWVRLYNVPTEYMNPEGLSYIASALGKPMYVDRATKDCYNINHSNRRGGSRQTLPYAKVCVEINPKDEGIITLRPAAERTMVIAIGDDEKENLVIVTAIYQLEEDGQGKPGDIADDNHHAT